MLALRLGPRHPVVRLVRAVERLLGRGADAHLCVSRALAAELERWGIGLATVFRDRPGVAFRPLPAGDRRQAKSELASRLRLPGLADGTTALLVSPTSWTADEDFELLMDAATRWDQRVGPTRPPLAVLVTGEGPRRVRAPLRRAPAALCVPANRLARTWRISALPGRGRPGTLPASFGLGPRSPDEGGGSVRGRRAGGRLRLRPVPGGDRPRGRQR